MIQLNEKYNREDFLDFLNKDFLPDFDKDIRPVNPKGLTIINKATYLGQSISLDLHIFELSYSESHANKRVALATDGFRIMQSTAIFNALIVFNPQNKSNWRLSLMTATPAKNEKGGVSVHLSNPRRFSFELGENTKINTPYSFLIKKGKLFDLDDLKTRFSIEVVNKEFYAQISELFTELVGGTRGEGRNQRKYPGIIGLPSVPKESRENHEFAVRLIGRLIFCWFLREKKSNSDLPLISREILSLEAANDNPDYYHSVLEPLFFEVLNKPFKLRSEEYRNHLFGKTPYLNGGLFTPQAWDYYDPKLRNVLKIPDEWIRKLFEVLELYNFTVDENTSVDIDLSIDPEMLGRIFENLLAEINPETGETARKSTGSYYTPRTIVDYMVDESLIQYLKDKTSIDEGTIRAIVSYDLSDDEDYPLDEDEKDRLIESLSKITILDPACGSGAFPIGALQKIVFILQRIDQDAKLWFKQQIESSAPEIKRIIEREFAERNFDYIRKLGIIRQSIFGVDIQPIATEIARLRCFLTLVVDERVVDEEENRGIEPLPNLDFKFVTANSLIGLPSSQANSQVGLFEDQEGINKLKEVRDMYFNASGTEREQIRTQFVQIQNKMFQKMIAESRHAELTSKLSSWNPFGHEASDWFDPDWMFGIKEGFDIVIANPPYISFQAIDKNSKNMYKKTYKSAKGKYDIYLLFIERALSLAKESEFICYIVPNKFIRSNYGTAIKKEILENDIIEIMDFNEIQVFDSVTNYTCILFIKKSATLENELFLYKKVNSLQNTEILWDANEINQFNLSNNTWLLGDAKENNLIEKIKKNEIILDDISISITQGIRTGHLKIYLENINSDFVKKNKIEEELVLPILHGKNTKRYFLSLMDSDTIIFPYKNDHKNPINIDQFPNTKKYLLKYKEKLLGRKDSGKVFSETDKIWYEYWDPKPICFTAPKIIFPDISNHNQFCLETKGIGYLNTCYGIFLKDKTKYKSILAILNSKLIEFFIKNISPSVRGGFYRYKTSYIKQIPLPNLDEKNERTLNEFVDSILKCGENSKESLMIEDQIDNLVYKLYDLTPEEIQVVENAQN